MKPIRAAGMNAPKCQARMKAEGLKNEKELQSYFIRRIEKFLASKNKKLIGWDEILEGGLPPEATVMSWRGIDGGIKAARQGHDVIILPPIAILTITRQIQCSSPKPSEDLRH